ncbi:MAG TPA: SusE domain-containing protein [Puia sp.]|nr:SusE domain-containing protein [Puia sp.]
MNGTIRTIFTAGLALPLFLACKKMSNPYYANGTTPTLKLSTTTLTPTPADSLRNVLALSWSNPHYATDSATELYTIQIDSSGRNFSHAVSIRVSGQLSDSLTAKQINTIALGFGFAYNVAYKMDVRLISSYANNNEQLVSNVITVTYTPYVIPPKVAPPSTKQLFLVGSATAGGWNNPVPVPSQQFEMVDSVDYAGVFNLTGGQQYLLLPKNGDWGNKYAVANSNVPATGGAFGYNGNDATYNNNFTGPDNSGMYEIWVNFQTGMFTVTPYNQFLPDSVFIVGSATAGGWNNPVPDPGQALTRVNSSQWQITLPLTGGQQYLLLPVNGDWSNKFAVANSNIPAAGGAFGYNGNNGTYNTNFNGPANSGTYTVTADFLNYTFTVK